MMNKLSFPPFEFNSLGTVQKAVPNHRNREPQTKLSRLPKLSQPRTFQPPKFDLTAPSQKLECVNCKVVLMKEADFMQKVKVCRKCLSMYSVIDAALNESADNHARAARLEKFTRGIR